MLISSMWLLEAANQSDLETGMEHNICPNPLRVNRGRKSHEKEMDASFFCSKPPMPTLRSSIPIRTTTAQHKNVKICFYITTEKEKPERGGAPPADGAGEASGGEVRRRADVALLLMFYCYLSHSLSILGSNVFHLDMLGRVHCYNLVVQASYVPASDLRTTEAEVRFRLCIMEGKGHGRGCAMPVGSSEEQRMRGSYGKRRERGGHQFAWRWRSTAASALARACLQWTLPSMVTRAGRRSRQSPGPQAVSPEATADNYG